MSNNAQLTRQLLTTIEQVLPPANAAGVDYHTIRERVPFGNLSIRRAVNHLIGQNRVEALRGGERNRKLFRRSASMECAR